MQCDVAEFGAIPDGETLTTAQLQSAIDACAHAGGGTVIVPAGNYVTGTLWLRSNITLHLEAGATLLGTSTNKPFSFTWNNAPAGGYALSAQATDNRGGTATSAPVVVARRISIG